MSDGAWLSAFHAGRREVLEACYRDHFETVERAIGGVLYGADLETVIHDVFVRLLSSAELRRNFQGGAFGAWLAMVARNQALDYLRRHQREQTLSTALAREVPPAPHAEAAGEAKELIDRFRAGLPPKWLPVFEARFIEQRTQRDAAAKLGMHRTTLVYQEARIRTRLRRFLSTQGGP